LSNDIDVSDVDENEEEEVDDDDDDDDDLSPVLVESKEANYTC
jgi:hypothetical protein